MSDEDKAEFATGVVLTGVTLRGGVRGAPRGERVGAAERVGATCSFGPSTPVATASGGVAISRVAVDDAVQTTDPTTGKTADHRVTAVMVHVDPVIEDLTIGGETIETTPNHRFLTADRGWVQAGDSGQANPSASWMDRRPRYSAIPSGSPLSQCGTSRSRGFTRSRWAAAAMSFITARRRWAQRVTLAAYRKIRQLLQDKVGYGSPKAQTQAQQAIGGTRQRGSRFTLT